MERSSPGSPVQGIASPPKSKIFTLYLIVLSVLGVALVFINTSTYGPGISSDGMDYLSTADSLVRGQGFTNFRGGVYILWPPLYPLILAGLNQLTGLDTFIVGWILNALCFGATIFLTGTLLKICFPDNLVWPAIGAFLTLFFTSYLVLASSIGSDSLFVVLVLAFFIASHDYLTTSSRWALWLMLLLAALAPLQRFLGICIVAVGALAVFARHREQPLKAAGKVITFGLVASLPILVWVIGRNYRLYGSLTGPRQLGRAYILENVAYVVRQILRWFVPLSILDLLPLWLIPALFLGILLLLARRRYWKAFYLRLSRSPQWQMVIFSTIYLLIIIFTTITADHTYMYDDRFQTIVYVPLLIILISIILDLVLPHFQDRNLPCGSPIAVILILVWSFYPIFFTYKYVLKSIQEGEAVYNMYNLRIYQESPVINYLVTYPFEPGALIYSNDPEAVYFFTRRTVHLSPRDLENDLPSPDYLVEHYMDWPEAPKAYLVWFVQRGDRRYYYSPEELEEIAILQPLIDVKKKGAVYLVQSQP